YLFCNVSDGGPCGPSTSTAWETNNDLHTRDVMGIKIIADNRKAFHEYIVTDRIEAGVVLVGTEVKSARAGKVNLSDGWIDFDDNGEAWLRETHIGKYSHGNIMNH